MLTLSLFQVIHAQAQVVITQMHEVGGASNAIWQPSAGTVDSRTSPANNLSLDNRLNPETDVMLRVECMSSRALKARLTLILVSTQTYTKIHLVSACHVTVFFPCTFTVSLQQGCKHWWSSLGCQWLSTEGMSVAYSKAMNNLTA